MKINYTTEIFFLGFVIALSLVGFSSLFVGSLEELTAFHYAHIATSLAWLVLLLSQLVLIQQGSFRRHRAVGRAIFFAGPVLVATLTLLTVHSAAKDAVAGRADFMIIQNVMVTFEVALLIVLAFALRRNRYVHGALLLGTAVLFMGIALFFTLISYVPGFAAGPGTRPRFAEAAQAISYAGGLTGLLFFLKNRKVGWPWLLAGSFFLLNGLLQVAVARMNGTKALTLQVASLGRWPAFALGLLTFAALLGWAWRHAQSTPRSSRQ